MTDCPDWAEDHPEHLLLAQSETAKRVIAAACLSAEKKYPERPHVEDWHRAMFADVVPLDYYAGNCRQADADRCCLQQDVCVGDVVGSPYHRVIDDLESLLKAVKAHGTSCESSWQTSTARQLAISIAQTIGLAVGGIVQIHPFMSGNGRMSRLMWRALLHRFGMPSEAGVIARPPQPYGAIMAAAMRGNYGPLMATILKAIAEQEPQLPQ